MIKLNAKIDTNVFYQTPGKKVTLTFRFLPVVPNTEMFMGFIPFPFITNNTNYTVSLNNCFIETIGYATPSLQNKYVNGCTFSIPFSTNPVAKAVYVEAVITFK